LDSLESTEYLSCVHPGNFYLALSAAARQCPEISNRFIGIQGNASRKSPEELDESTQLETDDPAEFSCAMSTLHKDFGIYVLGGCCGTDNRYIAAIAQRFGQG
jgi:homocysteine S-methyltransferase